MELILFVWELFSLAIWNLDTSRHGWTEPC